jgi:hypothetical protein
MKDVRAPQHQLDYNRRTADAWDRYESHRNRLAQILLKIKFDNTCSRLGILGAGNLNDFDLRVWIQHFRQIVLVDIDREAVERGLARQSLTHHERIVIVAPWDLTDSDDSNDDSARIPHGPFDVVVSSGLLSQLIEIIVLPQSDPQTQAANFLHLRRQHIRLLFNSLTPTGSILFVNDVVSSDTFSGLKHVPEASLGSFTKQLLEEGNFFIGNHPGVILNEIEQISRELQINAQFDFHPSWLWQIGPNKHHLMWGMTIHNNFEL